MNSADNKIDYCVCIGVQTRSTRATLGNFCVNCHKPLFPLSRFWPSQGDLSQQIFRGESSQELQHIYENIFNKESSDSKSSLNSLLELTGGRERASVLTSEHIYLQPQRVLNRGNRR